MPIDFDLPKGQMNIHANPRFRALPYADRVRVLSAWAQYWAKFDHQPQTKETT